MGELGREEFQRFFFFLPILFNNFSPFENLSAQHLRFSSRLPPGTFTNTQPLLLHTYRGRMWLNAIKDGILIYMSPSELIGR